MRHDCAVAGGGTLLFSTNPRLRGPVDRRIATGEAGPSDPPARVPAPVACAFSLQNSRRVEPPSIGTT